MNSISFARPARRVSRVIPNCSATMWLSGRLRRVTCATAKS